MWLMNYVAKYFCNNFKFEGNIYYVCLLYTYYTKRISDIFSTETMNSFHTDQ